MEVEYEKYKRGICGMWKHGEKNDYVGVELEA